MSRYRGPKLRITRRLGSLPGLTQKKSKKLNRPGQHGKILGEGKKKNNGKNGRAHAELQSPSELVCRLLL